MSLPKPPSHWFTLRGKGGRMGELRTNCAVCPAFDPQATPVAQRPPFHNFSAIWDTGATHSAVNDRVVATCGLQPFTVADVYTGNGVRRCNVYLVNLGLPNGLAIPSVRVTHTDTNATDVLVGMDIITLGDFSITNEGGITIFAFRIPSQHTIDFAIDPHMRANAHPALLQQGFQHGPRRHK